MPIDTAPAPAPAAPNAPTAVPDPKWWGNSVTIQGILITALTTVLPVLGPVFGLNITADLTRQLGDNVVLFTQAAGGLIGTIMAIYGRMRTSTPLQSRQITLRM
jgi:hypothetical protein